jgi:porphyrinogen peroxidase
MAEAYSGVVPQPVLSPLTTAAIFLAVTIDPGGESVTREPLPDLATLQRSVGFRVPEGRLSCVTGVGSQAGDRLFSGPHPAELHPFHELVGAGHRAVSTPGDLLFHIRATEMYPCFELASQIMNRLRGAVTVLDEVHGFVQKYLHDLRAWNAPPVDAQEEVIGRTKLPNIELDDASKPDNSPIALTTITDPDGAERQILRDNMPFGTVGKNEFGTYFIGYARTPAVTEKMLENTFVGNPPGNYDRILDFSTPVTGTLFFVPSAEFLDDPPGPPAPGTAGHIPETEAPDTSEVQRPYGGAPGIGG